MAFYSRNIWTNKCPEGNKAGEEKACAQGSIILSRVAEKDLVGKGGGATGNLLPLLSIPVLRAGRQQEGVFELHQDSRDDVFAAPYKTTSWRYQVRWWILGSGIWGRGSTWRYTFVSLIYLRT